MSRLLAHSRVLILGGSSGIGLATALKAKEAGARITIASRSRNKLDAAVARLGSETEAVTIDVSTAWLVESFFAERDPWDHVVVSAAQTPTGPVRKLDLEQAEAAMQSKFWGAYYVARAARIKDNGSLTFISGYLSVRPSAASVLQGAINAALESLGRGLALELAPVRVNTVSPGLIDTPLWSVIPSEQRQVVFSGAAARLPAGRVGRPDEIANAVLFLMTTAFANGSTVRVDGGGAIA